MPATRDNASPPRTQGNSPFGLPALVALSVALLLVSLGGLLSVGLGAELPEVVEMHGLLRALPAAGLIGLAGLALTGTAHLRRHHGVEAGSLRHLARQRDAVLQLLDLLPTPLALCDAALRPVYCNRALSEQFGHEHGVATQAPWDWQRVLGDAHWAALAAAARSALHSGGVQWLQAAVRLGDAEQDLLVQLAPLDEDLLNGSDGGFAVFLHLANPASSQQAALQLRQLLGTAEEEKWRFGQAVHDELGQRLAGMAFFARSLERKLQAAGRLEAGDAAWLTRLANESMSVARNLARGLLPVGSDDPQALAATLAEQCRSTGKMFGAQCTVESDPAFDAGGPAQANHLYHAVQELVTNALKHGRASNVRVRLEVLPRGQRVTVRNDGLALNAPDSRRRTGMGLAGVRGRVAHLGGQFTLGNDPEGGVLAIIELPLPPTSSPPPAGSAAQSRPPSSDSPGLDDNRASS